jgi:hypothetical protein
VKGNKNARSIVLAMFAVLVVLLSAGCVTLEEQEASFPAEGPVLLRPATIAQSNS